LHATERLKGAVAVPHAAAEIHGLAVHLDEFDVRVRHAVRLDAVLDAGRVPKGVSDVALAPLPRQQLVVSEVRCLAPLQFLHTADVMDVAGSAITR
jgi:hypothetical protein